MASPLGKDMVTLKQLAEHLQVKAVTIRRWRKEGLIDGTWNGRTWIFEPKDIDKLKSKRRRLKE